MDRLEKMKCTSRGIFGNITDDEGRCQHYHTPLDVIANRCGICGKFYACYKCHDEMENHGFGGVSPDEADSVMCGVCGATYSYNQYSQLCQCQQCGAGFNPRCSLHSHIYSCKS